MRQSYDAYVAAVATMYAERDDDYTRLLEWATSEMATREAAGVSDLAASGISVSSWYTVVAFELSGTLSVDACVDVSSVRLINNSGEDVTPPDRESLVPLALIFEENVGGTYLLRAQDPWDPAEASPCSG